MFDGVPEQFHKFITPRTSTSLPLHLPFPLHATTAFDPYTNNSHHHQLQLQHNLLHPILHHHHQKGSEEEEHPWSNDEVLALLRIRSSIETWFPHNFTWENVSRKLAEVGYKRSGEKCKEKFEEETRYFNNYGTTTKNNNYRFLSDLEQFYQADHYQKTTTPPSDKQDNNITNNMGHALEEDSRNDHASVLVGKTNKEKKKKKRKRSGSTSTDERRFEGFKGFCESVVKKMMEQQEEMHNKLIQDMLKRDEDKFSKEDAWKKQEMEKMNMELELMAREQAIAGDRQANIIQFLNKFSPTTTSTKLKVISTTSSKIHSQNPSPSTANPSSSLARDDTLLLQVLPSSTKNNPSSSLEKKSVLINKDDIGRRWPKDEVLALINLRCSGATSMNNNEEKEGNNKVAPLWERISQGMLELGYKRSAKRCKEKWENINKYFRKTKDANRKRSIDSRTCPYFHLLSNLYKQGKLVLQTERSESHLNNNTAEKQTQEDAEEAQSSQVGPAAGNFTMQQQQQAHHGGENKTVFQQVPSLDFDQF